MSGGPQRAQWYDRNPLSIGVSYEAAGLAPHASTQRASYTPPAGRKAFVTAGYATVRRDGVAGVSNASATFITFPGTPNSARIIYAEITSNALNDVNVQASGFMVLLGSGSISISTSDNSTGGTCYHRADFLATEFDE